MVKVSEGNSANNDGFRHRSSIFEHYKEGSRGESVFTTAKKTEQRERENNLRLCFNNADTDQDGTLSKEECEAAGLNPDRYQGLLIEEAVKQDI